MPGRRRCRSRPSTTRNLAGGVRFPRARDCDRLVLCEGSRRSPEIVIFETNRRRGIARLGGGDQALTGASVRKMPMSAKQVYHCLFNVGVGRRHSCSCHADQ